MHMQVFVLLGKSKHMRAGLGPSRNRLMRVYVLPGRSRHMQVCLLRACVRACLQHYDHDMYSRK